MLKNNKGLTLIEVLLTLTISVIVISIGFSLSGLGERINAYVNKEHHAQSNIRTSIEEMSNYIMKASSVFLHRSIEDVFTDNIYDFDSHYNNTVKVDNSYMNNKGRGIEYKKAIEEKYKGWSFITLSKDRKEIRNFIYNEDDDGNYYYIVKRIIAPTDIIYKLFFNRPMSNAKNNMVNMTLISEDSKGKVNEVVTEIEALNCLQVVNRGNNKEPATVMFYRLDERPMTEDVTGALTFVLDTSGSMSDNTVFNGNTIKKIEALKEVTKDYLNKLSDRSNLEIGIVEFNTTAHDPIPLKSAADGSFDNKIDGLNAGGGTNVGDGIRRAYHMLKDFNDIDESHKKANKYMILLMDGVPTYGAFQYDHSDSNAIKQDRDRGEIWNYNGYDYYNYKTRYRYIIFPRWYYGKVLDITNYDGNISNSNSTNSLKPGFKLTGDGQIKESSISAGMEYIDKMVEKMDKNKVENLKIFLIGFFTNDDNSQEEDNFKEIQRKLTSKGRIVLPYNAKDGDELEKAMHAIENIILDDYWHIYGPKE